MQGGPGTGKGRIPRIPPSRVLRLMHAHGLNIPKVSIASGLSEGTLSRLFKGERGGTTKTVLAVAEAAPTVPPLELLRALAQTRAEWLRHEKVRRLIATR